MDAEKLQIVAARDQLWASLRPLIPEIQNLADGRHEGSERERQMIQLVARIVVSELQFRAEQTQTD